MVDAGMMSGMHLSRAAGKLFHISGKGLGAEFHSFNHGGIRKKLIDRLSRQPKASVPNRKPASYTHQLEGRVTESAFEPEYAIWRKYVRTQYKNMRN